MAMTYVSKSYSLPWRLRLSKSFQHFENVNSKLKMDRVSVSSKRQLFLLLSQLLQVHNCYC